MASPSARRPGCGAWSRASTTLCAVAQVGGLTFAVATGLESLGTQINIDMLGLFCLFLGTNRSIYLMLCCGRN